MKDEKKIDWLKVVEVILRILTIGLYHLKKNKQ